MTPSMPVMKASDVLAEELRRLILGGPMEEGATLPSEAELVQQYSFSRGTVREALRLLETDNLITIRRGPKGGIRVRLPDVHQVSRSVALLFSRDQTKIDDLFQFRLLLEPAAAAAAALTATPEQRRRLIESAPYQDGFPAAADFHGLVGEGSNNGVFDILLTTLHDSLEWHASDEKLEEEDVEATRRAHIQIADAIDKGDAAAAGRRMKRHLEAFEKVLRGRGRLDEPIVPLSHWRQRGNGR